MNFNHFSKKISPLILFFFITILSTKPVSANALIETADKVTVEKNNTNATAIGKIEPPFWWSDMHNRKLQLMVYGENISNLKVESIQLASQIKNQSQVQSPIKIASVENAESPNYLFINLKLDNAPAGKYIIRFYSKLKSFEIDYELKTRKQKSSERIGFGPKDVVYLLTPDRFANGDASNDSVNSMKESANRNDEGGRHGGDIAGIIKNLDYIQAMGFTQLWLNPVLTNDQEKYSYHGYSTTDYYQIDARFGDNAFYRQLSENAQSKGIGLVKDIVLNHIGSNHLWMNDLPSNDWVNHGKTFKPTNHRRESLHDPHAVEEDIKGFTDGWFVPTMPDLNQQNLWVANYLIQNSIWWIEYANLSGIRIDTYPYSDKDFLASYTKRIMQEYPNFSLVGEEWTTNPVLAAYWQKDTQRHNEYQSSLNSVMDFPLQAALTVGLNEAESWSDGLQKLYSTIATDFIYGDPHYLFTFADNHDMSRIFTQLNEDVSLTKMALTFLLTTRGIPQIFYGTEILMSNTGTDSHGLIRSDFPGGWSGDPVNGFTGVGLESTERNFQSWLKQLLNWRKNTPAAHTGTLKHYAPRDGTYTYYRFTQDSIIVVIMNKNKQDKSWQLNDYPSLKSKVIEILGYQPHDISELQAKQIDNNKIINMQKAVQLKAKSALILELK